MHLAQAAEHAVILREDEEIAKQIVGSLWCWKVLCIEQKSHAPEEPSSFSRRGLAAFRTLKRNDRLGARAIERREAAAAKRCA
jgi:hypothetical protein